MSVDSNESLSRQHKHPLLDISPCRFYHVIVSVCMGNNSRIFSCLGVNTNIVDFYAEIRNQKKNKKKKKHCCPSGAIISPNLELVVFSNAQLR